MELNKENLERMYFKEKQSVPAIAEAFGTYPNKIRRALKSYGFDLRSNSEAQALALESGRAAHPTEGKERTEDEKFRIGSRQMENFKNMTKEEKEALADRSREAWENKSEAEVRDMRAKAMKGVQKAAREGSKLEKYLYKTLTEAGIVVQYHKTHFLVKEKLELDLYFPEFRTACEVDGKNHSEAIWGAKTFNRTVQADRVKAGLILNAGLCLVRISAINKSPTYFKKAADALIAKLKEIKENFPARENRLIILNVE